MVQPSQILRGNYATANARLRVGGWITISDRLAQQRGLAPGDAMELSTPTGRHRYRVAAITTNLGWGPGAIAMNGDEYRQDWATSAPTALEVDVAPGVSATEVRDKIRAALGPTSGLDVRTTPQAIQDANAIVSDGLARLQQISTLLLIVGGDRDRGRDERDDPRTPPAARGLRDRGLEPRGAVACADDRDGDRAARRLPRGRYRRHLRSLSRRPLAGADHVVSGAVVVVAGARSSLCAH